MKTEFDCQSHYNHFQKLRLEQHLPVRSYNIKQDSHHVHKIQHAKKWRQIYLKKQLGDINIKRKCNIKIGLKEIGYQDLGQILLLFRISLSGRVQWMQLQTYKYHEIWRISWTAEWLPFGQGNHANVCRVGKGQSLRQLATVKQPGFNSQQKLRLFCTELHPD